MLVFEPSCNLMIDVPHSSLNGILLERVRSFKYLGYIVSTELKENMDI